MPLTQIGWNNCFSEWRLSSTGSVRLKDRGVEAPVVQRQVPRRVPAVGVQVEVWLRVPAVGVQVV